MPKRRITVIGLKNCDACRKALKDLRELGHTAELRDLRDDPLSGAEISRYLDEFGDALINRRSTTWRGLDEMVRTQAPQMLLESHPTLMKRPLLVSDSGACLGWSGTLPAGLA